MESTKLFFPLLFIVSLVAGPGLAHQYSLRQPFEAINKLFVFGDSYVDTGNLPERSDMGSKYPNGITWPGKPSGRFSDGFVLTDYFASFLGLKSPIPYLQLHNAVKPMHIDGVNFAFGGSGVFHAQFPTPNLSDQIDFFQGLIDNSTLTSQYISSSIALVTESGNDYMANYFVNHSVDFADKDSNFVRSVVYNMGEDLKRIHSLGVKKVVVTTLEPLECTPVLTLSPSYKKLIPIIISIVSYHNSLLQEVVTKLNNETNMDDPPFSIFDFHAAFSFIFQNNGYPERNITFSTPLEPCNKGTDEICKNPKSAFYWDFVHPSHQGWLAVFSYLIDTLKKSFEIS